HVCIGGKMEHELGISERPLHRIQVEQVALDQTESRIRAGAPQKLAKTGGEIIEADDLVARVEQPVHQIAPDEPRRAGYERPHLSLPPKRCSSPILKMSRIFLRFPVTRSRRLSASSRHTTGTC